MTVATEPRTAGNGGPLSAARAAGRLRQQLARNCREIATLQERLAKLWADRAQMEADLLAAGPPAGAN